MERIPCSCGGENERCFRCDGRGWYEPEGWQQYMSLTPVHQPVHQPVQPPIRRQIGTRKIIVLENNPLPPPFFPAERRPKRPVITKVKSSPMRSDKKQSFKKVFLRLGSRKTFECFYLDGVINSENVSAIAAKFIEQVNQLDKDLFQAYIVCGLRILSTDRATARIKNQLGEIEEYRLRKNYFPHFVRIVPENSVHRKKVSRSKAGAHDNSSHPSLLAPPKQQPRHDVVNQVALSSTRPAKKNPYRREFLNLGPHRIFPCFYRPGRIQLERLLAVARDFTEHFNQLDKEFFKTNLVCQLCIDSVTEATARIRNTSRQIEEYRLRKNHLPKFVRMVSGDEISGLRASWQSATSIPHGKKEISKSKPQRNSNPRPKNRVDEAARFPEESGNPLFDNAPESYRRLDATRDHWQLRDHGQFGSSPSYDDFDE